MAAEENLRLKYPPPPANGYRPRCFFDLQINRSEAGRLIFELFADICPKTCENFRALCTGEKGEGKHTLKPLHFKNSAFHRVVKGFVIQGGDFTSGNGKGGESIYGGTFKDENFELLHNRPYLLSMANRGPNTNGSQFFITLAPAQHLDNVHTVFGHLISGEALVKDIESQKVNSDHKPYADIRIVHCGELVKKSKVENKDTKKKASRKARDKSSSLSSGSDNEIKGKRKPVPKEQESSPRGREKKKVEEINVQEPVLTEDGRLDLNYVPVVRHSFLMRRSRTPSPVRKRREKEGQMQQKSHPEMALRNRVNMVSKSGKKMRGRGVMRYRTPTPSSSDDDHADKSLQYQSGHRRRSKSPEKTLIRRSRSPRRRSKSPLRNTRSQRRRTRSPHRKSRSLRRRSRSPRRRSRSPRKRSRSPRRSPVRRSPPPRKRSPFREKKRSRSRDRVNSRRQSHSPERRGKFERHRSKSASASDSSVERKKKQMKDEQSRKPTVKEKIDMLLQKKAKDEEQIAAKEVLNSFSSTQEHIQEIHKDQLMDEPMDLAGSPFQESAIENIPLPSTEPPSVDHTEPNSVQSSISQNELSSPPKSEVVDALSTPSPKALRSKTRSYPTGVIYDSLLSKKAATMQSELYDDVVVTTIEEEGMPDSLREETKEAPSIVEHVSERPVKSTNLVEKSPINQEGNKVEEETHIDDNDIYADLNFNTTDTNFPAEPSVEEATKPKTKQNLDKKQQKKKKTRAAKILKSENERGKNQEKKKKRRKHRSSSRESYDSTGDHVLSNDDDDSDGSLIEADRPTRRKKKKAKSSSPESIPEKKKKKQRRGKAKRAESNEDELSDHGRKKKHTRKRHSSEDEKVIKPRKKHKKKISS